MGKPGYEVTSGSVTLDGVDVLALPTWERALAGLHLVMQYPTEVPGVMLDDVLAEALRHSWTETPRRSTPCCATRPSGSTSTSASSHRPLNVDLSGGEKKRNETLQLAMLRPKIAILDELDSGLDIDALRDCSRRVEDLSNDRDNGHEPLGVLAITHYSRLLKELKPDRVHILVGAASSRAAVPIWLHGSSPTATPRSFPMTSWSRNHRPRPAASPTCSHSDPHHASRVLQHRVAGPCVTSSHP